MELENIEEDVKFFHNTSSEKNRKRRRNNALKWRKDRNHVSKFILVDRKFSKRRLHKVNRKIVDLCRSTYYKSDYAFGTVCYAMT